MGFTWIFAFTAAFSGVAAMWYIYIIINSLQGLYIFIAFICNVRIRRLWAKKLFGSKTGDDFDTSTTKSRTSKSTEQSSTHALITKKLKTKEGNAPDVHDEMTTGSEASSIV